MVEHRSGFRLFRINVFFTSLAGYWNSHHATKHYKEYKGNTEKSANPGMKLKTFISVLYRITK